ncbi:HAD family hydrolase [Glycomyces buryatensis]|uniref:HAD family phosphatase n=1 Tax=Glycomyces buryatensis TaxID=2570927 RepID=A0A4S8Q625_9ACTN|nr:HAD family hydrolase [Glycomyces buryatensis]THV38701.1 hypothetical protein FAB82_19935 [Glycomyces buryatensis]
MSAGTRVLVTDIGSVLFRFDPDHRFALLEERTGRPRAELDRLLFASGFETRCEAGEFTADEIRDRVAEMTGFEGTTEELSNLWTSAFTLDEEVLQSLTDSGLTLAIFSNNGPLFADYFAGRFPEAAKWFRHRYFASNLKARKPDEAAFETVTARLHDALGTAPYELLLIDDNRQNSAAAVAAGWQAHTFAGPSTLRDLLTEA